MELQEAVVLYRAQIAELFRKLDPPPTEEWIAQKVDRVMPLTIGAAPAGRAANGRPASLSVPRTLVPGPGSERP
jgi:hypothetical protein